MAAQSGDPDSTLALYRAALRIRRTHPALAGGPAATAGAGGSADGRAAAEAGPDGLTWLEAEPGVLAFARPAGAGSPGLVCAVNLSGAPVRITGLGRPILASAPPTAQDGAFVLPVDAAGWFEPA